MKQKSENYIYRNTKVQKVNTIYPIGCVLSYKHGSLLFERTNTCDTVRIFHGEDKHLSGSLGKAPNKKIFATLIYNYITFNNL